MDPRCGYRCGQFGKYINFWDGIGGVDAPDWSHVARVVTSGGNAYDFTVHRNTGTTHESGTYETDCLATSSVRSSPAHTVLRLWRRACRTLRSPRATSRRRLVVDWPIVDEVDVSDKPSWIQALPRGDRARTRSRSPPTCGVLSGSCSRRRHGRDGHRQHRVRASRTRSSCSRATTACTSESTVVRPRREVGSVRRRVACSVARSGSRLRTRPGSHRTGHGVPGSRCDAPRDGRGTAGRPNQSGVRWTNVVLEPAGYTRARAAARDRERVRNRDWQWDHDGSYHTLGFRKLYRYPSVLQAPTGPFTYEAYDLDTDPDEFRNWAGDAPGAATATSSKRN